LIAEICVFSFVLGVHKATRGCPSDVGVYRRKRRVFEAEL